MQTDLPGPMPERLSLNEALIYFAFDLPHMTECDLARTLCEILHGERSALGDAVEPMLREELRKRQCVTDR